MTEPPRNPSGNGHNHIEFGDGKKTLRVDDRRDAPSPELLGPAHAGRSFVVALGIVLAALAIALIVLFRQWRDRQAELAEYGARNLATAVLPLANRVPPGIEPGEWALVVDQTRIALEVLSASGLLELGQMQTLRRDLIRRIDPARPEDAATVLEGIWTTLERSAGPALTQSPKLELAATIEPLTRNRPVGVSPQLWDLALARTRALLIAAANSPNLDLPPPKRRALRDLLAARLLRSRPESAAQDLDWVWQTLDQARLIPEGFSPPQLKPQPPNPASPASPP
ncbi:MAG: hypothetical protein KatS3mg108_0314 [Isosphaeraceae bacterium]|jgi:hypothetical protein|nr:MAG: hypothetical protein KatS3mg108_0314 [Isosphaeraceae bacterium]